jgi:sarcosine oxidase
VGALQGEVDVVVVGAGVLGAAVARHAARAGLGVVLVEQAEAGHPRSASSDETRIIRCAHGDDAWHARSARRAWELWHRIDPALVAPIGVQWLARRDDGFEAASERTLRALGIPCERVEPCAAGPFAWALHEPEAGVLRARRATRVLAAQAADAGARLVRGVARPEGDRVVAGGEVLAARWVVWACGAWLVPMFPQLFGGVRVTQQDVFWFEADVACPAWCDFDGAAYGAGSVDGAGLKVCPDTAGPPMDPDVPPPPDLRAEAVARELLRERFPAHADAPLRHRRTCHYELTADTRPVLAPHPERPSHWLLGGTSGHGFKHAPAWAELLVDRWLPGHEAPPPELGLGARTAGVSLRTAG